MTCTNCGKAMRNGLRYEASGRTVEVFLCDDGCWREFDKVLCEKCQKPLTRQQITRNRTVKGRKPQRFCSYECGMDARAEGRRLVPRGTTRTCLAPNCDREFEVKSYRYGQRYCSQLCGLKWRRSVTKAYAHPLQSAALTSPPT